MKLNKKTIIIIIIIIVAIGSGIFVFLNLRAKQAELTLYKREKLTFVTESYPPFNYLDKKGEVGGIVTEFVREIMDRQGIDEEISLMQWSKAYNMALNEKNVAIFSIRRTKQREDLFSWVGPVTKTETIFYAKKGSGIILNSMEEAKKISKIGVVNEWFSAQDLREDGFLNLVGLPHQTDVVGQLMNGEVLIAPFTDVTIKDIMAEAGYAKGDVEPVFTINTGYNYIGFSEGTPQSIVERWQKDLDEMKADGTFDEIYNKYTQ